MSPAARLLQDVLLRAAEGHPDRCAIVSGDMRLTYREVVSRANRLARLLQDNGIGRGDRVVIIMENGWRCAVAIFAVLLSGGVFVPVNSQTKHEKLSFIVEDSGARLMLSEPNLKRAFGEAAIGVQGLKVLCWGELPDGDRPQFQSIEDASRGLPDTPPKQVAITLDLAAVIYTSGTTGNPKGVMHTHQSLLFALESINEYLGYKSDDRLFSALPLSFGYGLFQWLSAMRACATLVLEPSFTYPGVVFNKMREESVTSFASVPTVFAMMLAHSAKLPLHFESVRIVTNAAAALPADYLPGIKRLFPNAALYKMYGQTECIRTAYLEPSLSATKPGSVGRAIPGTELMILNELGGPVAQGEVGTLFVRGPHVMRGYWNQPEKSAEVLVPEIVPGEYLLKTGDLFRQDADGDLHFVARTDDIIKSRGEKVSPAEVEKAIRSLPAVKEVVVAGVPDAVLGQAVCAFVSSHDALTITAQDVKRICSERLENFMVPKHVVLIDSLPVTENGKLSRKLVIEQCSGLIDRSTRFVTEE